MLLELLGLRLQARASRAIGSAMTQMATDKRVSRNCSRLVRFKFNQHHPSPSRSASTFFDRALRTGDVRGPAGPRALPAPWLEIIAGRLTKENPASCPAGIR